MSETKMSIEEIEEIINEDVASMRYRNRAGELVTIRAFLRRVQERMAELEKAPVCSNCDSSSVQIICRCNDCCIDLVRYQKLKEASSDGK